MTVTLNLKNGAIYSDANSSYFQFKKDNITASLKLEINSNSNTVTETNTEYVNHVNCCKTETTGGRIYYDSENDRTNTDVCFSLQNIHDDNADLAPTTWNASSYNFIDKNGVWLSGLEHHHATDGRVTTLIACRNQTGDKSDERYNMLEIGWNPDKTPYTSITNAPIDAIGSQIVNAWWISQKFQKVSAMPASPDPNVIYFVV